jgi:hypothetical protein
MAADLKILQLALAIAEYLAMRVARLPDDNHI